MPPGQLSGEEVVCVADVVRAPWVPGIWSVVARGVVRPQAAGGHWWGDERNKHWGGSRPLWDQLPQRIRRVHACLAFLQSPQLPRLLEPQNNGNAQERSERQAPSSNQECGQWYRRRILHWEACRICRISGENIIVVFISSRCLRGGGHLVLSWRTPGFCPRRAHGLWAPLAPLALPELLLGAKLHHMPQAAPGVVDDTVMLEVLDHPCCECL